MLLTPLLALCLLPRLALPAAGPPPPDAPPALTRPEKGRLVTSGHEWQALEEPGTHRLCLTVENRDHRTAYDVVAWVELLGGAEALMRRLALRRTPIEPSTLAPGEQGGACLDTPTRARGVFIRLRARWPAGAPPSRSGGPRPSAGGGPAR